MRIVVQVASKVWSLTALHLQAVFSNLKQPLFLFMKVKDYQQVLIPLALSVQGVINVSMAVHEPVVGSVKMHTDKTLYIKSPQKWTKMTFQQK